MTARRALFLDKDGVINVDHGYVCTPERTDFIDGIFDLCRASTRNGFLNVVVTNQAGIARGHYAESQFLAYMDWVRSEFRKRDARLDAVYYCPHHPVHGIGDYLRDCECRKPKPGMLLAAQRDLGLDLGGSILIGDSGSDIGAGEAAGVGTCLRVAAIMDQATMRPAFAAGTLQHVLTLLEHDDARPADA
ncbi:MAG: HAD family hydrolase [Rhodanobacteraceae bacterium]|nr:MAG: HAD family hydrolase [Rhodanobacteraceae bacterium]